jgi:hypothetical protein
MGNLVVVHYWLCTSLIIKVKVIHSAAIIRLLNFYLDIAYLCKEYILLFFSEKFVILYIILLNYKNTKESLLKLLIYSLL